MCVLQPSINQPSLKPTFKNGECDFKILMISSQAVSSYECDLLIFIWMLVNFSLARVRGKKREMHPTLCFLSSIFQNAPSSDRTQKTWLPSRGVQYLGQASTHKMPPF